MSTIVLGSQPNPYQILQASLQPSIDAVSRFNAQRVANANQQAEEQRRMQMEMAIMGERFKQNQALEAQQHQNHLNYLKQQDTDWRSRRIEEAALNLQTETGIPREDGETADAYVGRALASVSPDKKDDVLASNTRLLIQQRNSAINEMESVIKERLGARYEAIKEQARLQLIASYGDKMKLKGLAADASTTESLIASIKNDDDRFAAQEEYNATVAAGAEQAAPGLRQVISAHEGIISGLQSTINRNLSSFQTEIPADILGSATKPDSATAPESASSAEEDLFGAGGAAPQPQAPTTPAELVSPESSATRGAVNSRRGPTPRPVTPAPSVVPGRGVRTGGIGPVSIPQVFDPAVGSAVAPMFTPSSRGRRAAVPSPDIFMPPVSQAAPLPPPQAVIPAPMPVSYNPARVGFNPALLQPLP